MLPSFLDLSNLRFIGFDFDGVFTDNSVFVDAEGRETVRCYRSDGIGLKRLSKVGVKAAVISSEANDVVSVRCRKLGITSHHGVDDKLSLLKQILSKHNILAKHAGFVGNDINDLTVMRFVGFPIAVADAYGEVKNTASWVTDNLGGYGAVREICDAIYKKKYQNTQTLK